MVLNHRVVIDGDVTGTSKQQQEISRAPHFWPSMSSKRLFRIVMARVCRLGAGRHTRIEYRPAVTHDVALEGDSSHLAPGDPPS